ncbi:hypothetical protein [Brucella pseudogrignonensis]|uniref:hypothetical protein n=1 Tax=Brucella pseudogrignonensis TaxID=419475 RepID=UPI003B9E985A
MMFLPDFQIGQQFSLRDVRYLCTDVGMRVAVAIQIDRLRSPDGTVINLHDAQTLYGVKEEVIDESDMMHCWPVTG